MYNGDPREVPKSKWSVRVVERIAESEHVCTALIEISERLSVRLFLLIYFVLDLVRHFKR